MLGIIVPSRLWLAFWLVFQRELCLSPVPGIDGDEELEKAYQAQEAVEGVPSARAFEVAFP
jgi:hypothetical protein